MDRSAALLERAQKLSAQRNEIENLVMELQSFTLEPTPAAPPAFRIRIALAMGLSFALGALAVAWGAA